jgi:hypothetical protein
VNKAVSGLVQIGSRRYGCCHGRARAPDSIPSGAAFAGFAELRAASTSLRGALGGWRAARSVTADAETRP